MKTTSTSLWGLLALSLSFSPAQADDQGRFTEIAPEWQEEIYRQYDFWIGHYHANWRQKNPDEFFHQDQGGKATHWLYPTLNGKALLEFGMGDEPTDDKGTRTQGFSVRYYDEAKERWVMSQEWPGRDASSGVLDQLQGFYRFGQIQVFSSYILGDPPVEKTRRYSFTDIRPEGFHWHGQNTADKGAHWNAGTLVEFSRLKTTAPSPGPGENIFNYDNGNQCTDPAYRTFDNMQGEWKGTATIEGREKEATLTGYFMLGGCAVLSYLDFEYNGVPYTLLEVRSRYTGRNEWWVYQLDSLKGTPHTYQAEITENGKLTLIENKHYVIDNEFEVHMPRLLERDDANALKKTVWITLGENELAFEWWNRKTPEGEWELEASFQFEK